MDVYAAGEEPIPGAEGRALAEGIASHGHRDTRFIGEREAVVEYLQGVVQSGDIVITLGAGSVWQVGEQLARQLREKG
jgi:UDP-N-acetylmuramate--alanine ligase